MDYNAPSFEKPEINKVQKPQSLDSDCSNYRGPREPVTLKPPIKNGGLDKSLLKITDNSDTFGPMETAFGFFSLGLGDKPIDERNHFKNQAPNEQDSNPTTTQL